MMANKHDMRKSGLLRSLVALCVLAAMTASPSMADTFYWEGDNNDNWLNYRNWQQQPGSGDVPENDNDVVYFDETADRMDVDVNGNTYDVGPVFVYNTPYRIYNGTLRLHRDLTLANHGDTHFDSDLTIEQTESRYWTIWDSTLLVDGVLTGSQSIVLDGNGQVTFNSVNPYSGTLYIGFPKVVLGTADALHNSTVRVNASPNRLEVNGLNATVGALGGSGDIDVGQTTLTVGGNNASTDYAGTLSSGSLVKQGVGAMTLSGDLDNVDTLTNNSGGTLNITGGGDVERLLAPTGAVNVGGGATLNLNSEITNTLYVSNDAAAQIKNGAVVTLTGTVGSNRTVLTNDATLTVQNVGSTLVTPRLDIGPSGGGSAEVIVQTGGAVSADRVRVGDLGADDGAAGTLTIVTGGAIDTDSTILYRRGDITIDGGALSTNTLADGDAEPHVISISDPSSGPALTIGVNDGNSTVDALIEDAFSGPGTIRKVGTGSLTLSNANTFSGGIRLDGGTLEISDPNQVGTGPIVAAAGTTIGQSAFLDLPNTIELHGDTTVRVDGGENFAIGDFTEVGGSFGVTKQGIGTLWIAQPKSCTGTMTIENGVLGIDVADAYTGPTVSNGGKILFEQPFGLRSSAVQLNVDNGLLFVHPTSPDFYEMGSLAGAGDLVISNAGAGLKVGGNDTSTTYSGVLFGDNQLIKAGTGAFELTADNAFTGGVTIDGGTLLANNTTGSATGTGGVTVNDGGTLGGNGSVASLTQVHSGGAVAPGASAGLLTVDDVTFDDGSTFAVELAGNGGVAGTDFDQLTVINTATINADATLELSYFGGFTAAPGDSFVILSAGASLSGTFNTVNFPDGQDWFISYGGGAVTIGVNVSVPCPADLSGDGTVDLTDLGILLGNYGTGTTQEEGDLNGDGVVDLTDLGILLSLYGTICP